MLTRALLLLFLLAASPAFPQAPPHRTGKLRVLGYNHPGLAVDLGVGLWAWPIPVDYDGDGDLDLLVSCPCKPYNGIFFFENREGKKKFPLFKPAVRIGAAIQNIQPSYPGGRLRVLAPAREITGFHRGGTLRFRSIYPRVSLDPRNKKIRANQWKYCDYDGDGDLDLVVGVGDWADYGWDDAFDAKGRWTRGPLHGFVYLIRNVGTDRKPRWDKPTRIRAGGKPIDVYGMPSPNPADFDGDGDLDIICGEFLDRFTWFENVGTRTHPVYAPGRFLRAGGRVLRMDLEMIVPVAFDWDGDGDVDLVVGQEDGRVALVENSGKKKDGMPLFLPPRFFRQEADRLKFGALATPFAFDWDGDGDQDLLCGNTAGYLGFIENLGGGDRPRWAATRLLRAGGKVIRIQAGPNGSVQGPCEAKWGYTVPVAADWDMDGLPDLLVNSILGEVLWFRNVGTRKRPRLAPGRPIRVEWPGPTPKPAWTWWKPRDKELLTQWRTTPAVLDWNGDGLPDLVMLDQEGYLALFERARREGKLLLLPGKRVFLGAGPSAFDSRHRVLDPGPGLLRLNARRAGLSGRRKFCFADWDGDGRLDLLVNSKGVNFLRNMGEKDGRTLFRDMGELTGRVLAGHTTCPTVVDWNRDGIPDLLVGAEDGRFYYLENPRK